MVKQTHDLTTLPLCWSLSKGPWGGMQMLGAGRRRETRFKLQLTNSRNNATSELHQTRNSRRQIIQPTLWNICTKSTTSPASIWKWPATEWRHAMISWPTWPVFKKAILWLYCHTWKIRKSNMLQTCWDGPYIITQIVVTDSAGSQGNDGCPPGQTGAIPGGYSERVALKAGLHVRVNIAWFSLCFSGEALSYV